MALPLQGFLGSLGFYICVAPREVLGEERFGAALGWITPAVVTILWCTWVEFLFYSSSWGNEGQTDAPCSWKAAWEGDRPSKAKLTCSEGV